jgi:stearoyl-CoA desaturase (delta-9 desaturase)
MPERRKDPINWPISLFIISIHVGAVVALFNFSWPAFGVAALLAWIGGGLGIAIGHHRLLSHRSFEAPKYVEYFLTICGAIGLQGGSIAWVAKHRLHHALADSDGDPHSPRQGLWWSHFGWIMTGKSDNREVEALVRYAPELAKDRFHLWLSKWNFVPQLVLIAILYLAGGWRFVLWGVCVPVVYTWHAAFLANSYGHTWGRRRFETRDNSRNNWWLGLISGGEGWHNNHHAHPASARHGLSWYEIDLNWYAIWTMKKLGLVKKIRLVNLPKNSAEVRQRNAIEGSD